MKRKEIKITQKLQNELIEFNRFYRKPQHLRNLTMEEYVNYLSGKGLPDCKPSIEIKPLKSRSIPDWAFDPNTVKSAEISPDYIATAKNDSYKKEISKNYTVAIAYNKGGYQVLRKEEIINAGKKV